MPTFLTPLFITGHGSWYTNRHVQMMRLVKTLQATPSIYFILFAFSLSMARHGVGAYMGEINRLYIAMDVLATYVNSLTLLAIVAVLAYVLYHFIVSVLVRMARLGYQYLTRTQYDSNFL